MQDVLRENKRRIGGGEWFVAALAVVCYINTPLNDFCDDGKPIVRDGRKVNEPGQWLTIWTTDYWSEAARDLPNRDLLYRPVSVSTFRIVRVLFGSTPVAQHVLNIVLYALLCAIVVRLAHNIGATPPAALTAGAIFAVLPIHTEVINNVVGRADLLAAVGTVAALLAHRRSLPAASTDHAAGKTAGVGSLKAGRLPALQVRGSMAKYSAGWCVLAGAAVFLAMGAKESGTAVVLLVPLFDALWYRHFSGHGFRRWFTPATVGRLSYLLVPAGVYFALRFNALAGELYQQPHITKTINVLVDAPAWQQVLGVLQLWGMYWAKTIWPAILSVNYSVHAIRLATSPLNMHVLIGVGALLVVATASVVAWRRNNPQIPFLSLALLVTYLPTSNAVILMQVFFAERNWFLPSIWVALLFGFGAAALRFADFRSHGHRAGSSRVPNAAWYPVLIVIILAMTVRCWVRNAEWRNDGTLYAAAYRDLPHGVGAQYLYGQWLVSQSELQKGVSLLTRAIETDLGFTDAHRVLGQAYLGAGNLQAAMRHLSIANMQAPGHPPTEAALRQLAAQFEQTDEQLRELRARAAKNPDDPDTELALTARLLELGLIDEALKRFRTHEFRHADSADWQAAYAETLLMNDMLDESIERYRASLERDPDDPQRAAELAALLLERRNPGDLDEAWQWSNRAISVAPELPSALACRAELLALRGDLRGAWEHYRRAIERLPPESPQRRYYEQRAKTLGAGE